MHAVYWQTGSSHIRAHPQKGKVRHKAIFEALFINALDSLAIPVGQKLFLLVESLSCGRVETDDRGLAGCAPCAQAGNMR